MDLKVLCAAPCGKTPVFDKFYDAFASLEVPEGSIKQRVMGGSVPQNLNRIVQSAVDHECSHVFIVEDDSMFATDTLLRLLAHDKPVVTGLCRCRQAPFKPYIYEGVNDGGLIWRDLRPEDSGLIKVAATGMGGVLINMDVFDRLTKPYFQTYFVGETEWGQDIVFGASLIAAGVEVYCDLDVTIWHATQCIVGSERVNGKWTTVFNINDAALRIT